MGEGGIAELKEKVTQNMFKLIQAEDANQHNIESDRLDVEICSIESGDEVITELSLKIKIKLPLLRTKEMDKGINAQWIEKFRSVFKEIGGGSDKLLYSGDWVGETIESDEEEMVMIICDTPLKKWRDTTSQLKEMLKLCQVDLKQEAIYLEIGTEGTTCNFLTKKFLDSLPPTDEFTEDDKFKPLKTPGITNNFHGPVHHYNNSENGIADISSGDAGNKKTEETLKKFSNLLEDLTQKFTNIHHKTVKEFGKRIDESNLINHIESPPEDECYLSNILEHKDSPVLFTCMFKGGLDLSEVSLKLIKCKETDGVYSPADPESFFDDIKLIRSKLDANDFHGLIKNNEMDIEKYTNAKSLLQCVIGDLEPNHPEKQLNNAQTRYLLRVNGKGSQGDVVYDRFNRLEWGMDNYFRDQGTIDEFYGYFQNYPFLAIKGPGGAGKTALMQKLVWESLHDDEMEFDHYLILTSKGKNQGRLSLMPGSSKSIVTEPKSRDRIARYFNSFADFIRQVVVINSNFNPEEDFVLFGEETKLAVQALKEQKILLVIDNFEDFEDGHEDYEKFEAFFVQFNKITKPDSRIIMTTRGVGKYSSAAKTLLSLQPYETSKLFVQRIEWLLGKGHYKKINPETLVPLFADMRTEIENHKEESQREIGHPATVLLLAASLKDDIKENPSEFIIKHLKQGAIGAGNSEFYKYCIIKSLKAQKQYPYLEDLTYKLTKHNTITADLIVEVTFDLIGKEIEEQDADSILKLLDVYSFITKDVIGSSSQHYQWLSWPKKFILAMHGDTQKRNEPEKQIELDNEEQIKITNFVEEFIRIQKAELEIVGESGPDYFGKKSWADAVASGSKRSEAVGPLIEKLKEDDSILEGLFNWENERIKILAFKLYCVSTEFVGKGWDKKDVFTLHQSLELIRLSLKFIKMFNDHLFSNITNPDGEWISGVQISLSNCWRGVSEFSDKFPLLLPGEDDDEWMLVRREIEKFRGNLIFDFKEITLIDSNFNESAIREANLLIEYIYEHKELGERGWKNTTNEEEKNRKIREAEDWIGLFKNLKANLQYSESIVGVEQYYALVCANLAVIHSENTKRVGYLRKAVELAHLLPVSVQTRIGQLKDAEQTGYFNPEELFDLDLRFEAIPVGTTICLNVDPVRKNRFSSKVFVQTKHGLTKKFTLLFNNDSVNCNGEKYLVDVVKTKFNPQHQEHILTVRVRRTNKNQLIVVKTAKDGKVDRNSLILEDTIIAWATELLDKEGEVTWGELEEQAKINLLPQTKFDDLNKLKLHLTLVHPELSKCRTTWLGIMIVRMVEKRNGISFFITNEQKLATSISPKKKTKDLAKLESKGGGERFIGFLTNRGLSLPEDPMTLATLLHSAHIYVSSKKETESSQLKQHWLQTCANNSISKTRGWNLFKLLCELATQRPGRNRGPYGNLFFNKKGFQDCLNLSNGFYNVLVKKLNELMNGVPISDTENANKILKDYFIQVNSNIAQLNKNLK